MNITKPQDMLTVELREIYSAERQLSRALPRLQKAAQADTVKECLQVRRDQGEGLIEDVDAVFDELGISKGRQKNFAMEGLIEEAQGLLESIKDEKMNDAAIIAAVQKMEHYCMAAWGTVAAVGKAMGSEKTEKVFQKALSEGKDLDKKMTEIAVKEINPAMLKEAS